MKALYLIAAMALLSQVQWSKASVSFFGEGYELGVKAIQAALDIMKEQNSGFDFELVADYGGQQQTDYPSGGDQIFSSATVKVVGNGESKKTRCTFEFGHKNNEITVRNYECDHVDGVVLTYP